MIPRLIYSTYFIRQSFWVGPVQLVQSWSIAQWCYGRKLLDLAFWFMWLTLSCYLLWSVLLQRLLQMAVGVILPWTTKPVSDFNDRTYSWYLHFQLRNWCSRFTGFPWLSVPIYNIETGFEISFICVFVWRVLQSEFVIIRSNPSIVSNTSCF